jgi:hypothetical protein
MYINNSRGSPNPEISKVLAHKLYKALMNTNKAPCAVNTEIKKSKSNYHDSDILCDNVVHILHHSFSSLL